jgi:arginine exporter protein ArgO
MLRPEEMGKLSFGNQAFFSFAAFFSLLNPHTLLDGSPLESSLAATHGTSWAI